MLHSGFHNKSGEFLGGELCIFIPSPLVYYVYIHKVNIRKYYGIIEGKLLLF